MKKKAYEILFIISTKFSQEERESTVEKVKSWIEKSGASIIEFNDMGLKDFAMELKKEKQGHYYQSVFQASQEELDKINAELKLTEDVFRYLIVLLDSVLTKEEIGVKLNQ